ncbi:hypothetical protein TNIN_334991 [Trichonephila inaurata madagascariensis]|uniref:Uncharacterized protein n=1 Tax=Trichonephila inaurata madagascariensis TaxID=2747483 RepID=A0A8X6XMY7_9ARAC|nr:hypothetical protein TNIN_334991 [Trichonephila inaurata madagascariensis]
MNGEIVEFQWIPSHLDIEGDEKADLLMKSTATLSPDRDHQRTSESVTSSDDRLQEKPHRKTTVVFLDLSATFNRVWRQKLIEILHSLGISGETCDSIVSCEEAHEVSGLDTYNNQVVDMKEIERVTWYYPKLASIGKKLFDTSDSEAEKSPCCSSFGKSPPKEEIPPIATKIEVVSMSKLPFDKNRYNS